MPEKLRIIFAGTPDFSARYLDALLLSGHLIVGVFTQPDRASGRGKKLTSNPVKTLAKERGLPIFQPACFQERENRQWIMDLHPDIMIVVAYGVILPREVLVIPRLGCINVHGSLLPRWRGAAPIQRALWAGDNETGITIIQMDEGVDTGKILYRVQSPITSQDTSATLSYKLSHLGTKGLIETLKQLQEGSAKPKIQDESLVTYAKKLSKEEARISWSLPAVELERCIRAFNPWPMSWFMVKGEIIIIWKASVIHDVVSAPPGTILKAWKDGIQVSTSNGILNLELLQLPGKRKMGVQDLLNSRKRWFMPGIRLT